MKRWANIAMALAIIGVIVVVLGCSIYKYNIGPVSKDSNKKDIIINEGETYYSIASILKENNLIKSDNFYKLYIKLTTPEELHAGKYSLSEDMGVEKIVEILEKGSNYNPDAVSVTLIEGESIENTAIALSKVTNNDKNELLNYWNSEEFIDKAIKKYWFITDEVKNDNLIYALEGYFYPSTYELTDADVDAEYLAFKFLDQMELVLNKYKTDIENSDYTVHEILSLASIIEGETANKIDRYKVSGVFHNRLDIDMLLQSCVTLGYATGEHKLTYYGDDLLVDSPYNTYMYYGLPVGPGTSVSESSIDAALNPESHNYYYFLANVCDPNDTNTYFSETLDEHEYYSDKYLNCL